ncbi:tail fiber protein [Pelosinus sp. UFO1]|uniref:tail fiber protein n=1 Tax=Pelosinus sp. UFO1 TaxID=484770 RepID=UPI0004D13C0D|nr:tail fiber protein [Pelosinus sp. UFO1]AIF54144.1 Tail Collar domain protein [Pelosinus sp. UFO1]
MTKFETNLTEVIEELQVKDVELEAKDVDLQNQIDSEVVARTDADTKLQANIDAEANARNVTDKDLQDQITKEVIARTDSEKALQTNIDAEANARNVADKDLQGQITKEIAARTEGDKALQSSIDAEIVARADADSKLQIAINTEVDARTKADQGLQVQIDALNIAGTVQYFARQTAPDGWLKANGSAVSRAQYAKLFAAIGTLFGAGDGSTTFNLPDLRGEFVRGFDDGRGVDAGRTLGGMQNSLLGTHYHALLNANLNAGGMIGAAPGDGNVYNDSISQVVTKTSGDPVIIWANTSPTGGAETRPRNIALLACIKY